LNTEKIEKEFYDFMKWGAEPQEKHYKKDDHGQTKLKDSLFKENKE
jgi:hypothetical protein